MELENKSIYVKNRVRALMLALYEQLDGSDMTEEACREAIQKVEELIVLTDRINIWFAFGDIEEVDRLHDETIEKLDVVIADVEKWGITV